MPTNRLGNLIVLAGITLTVLPGVARAGDRPSFMVGDWGLGEIDGRLLIYTGRDSHMLTRIPAPPHGPRWDFAYSAFPFVALGGVGAWSYRHRHRQVLQQTWGARRGFARGVPKRATPGR